MYVIGLMVAKTGFIHMLPHGVDQASFYLVDKILKLAVFLPASWIMPICVILVSAILGANEQENSA